MLDGRLLWFLYCETALLHQRFTYIAVFRDCNMYYFSYTCVFATSCYSLLFLHATNFRRCSSFVAALSVLMLPGAVCRISCGHLTLRDSYAVEASLGAAKPTKEDPLSDWAIMMFCCSCCVAFKANLRVLKGQGSLIMTSRMSYLGEFVASSLAASCYGKHDMSRLCDA